MIGKGALQSCRWLSLEPFQSRKLFAQVRSKAELRQAGSDKLVQWLDVAAGSRRRHREERLVPALRDRGVFPNMQKRIVDARVHGRLGRQQAGIFVNPDADVVITELQRMTQQEIQYRGRWFVVSEPLLCIERVKRRPGGVDQPLHIILSGLRIG